jgi:hypothetical protein
VVPVLQMRGLYRTGNTAGTLRERFFDGGAATLPASHPGAAYRR